MYGGVNNPNAMRMLQSLYSAHSAPQAAPTAAPKAKAPARRRAPSPSVSSSTDDSDSYESDSSSSYSSYDDVEVIYKKVVEEAACPYVSPAGLRDQKTKKDAIKHLKAKKCPEVPKLRKGKGGAKAAPKADEKPKAEEKVADAKPVQVEQTPKPEIKLTPEAEEIVRTGVKKRVAKPKKTVTVSVPAAPAPAEAPAAKAAAKTKRAPSSYQKFMGEQLRAGKSMKEVAAAWKAQKGQ